MLPHGVTMSRFVPSLFRSRLQPCQAVRVIGRLTLWTAWIAAAVGFLSPSALAQSPPVSSPPGDISTGILGGVVRDTLGTPVAGAQIVIVGQRGHGTSAEDGTFRLASVEPGDRILVARRIGFRPESVSVRIAAGTITEIDVPLRPNAVRLASVVIDARSARYSGFLRGFYERRDRGNGVFFTAADIEERNPRLVTDMLRGIPGVRIIPGSTQSIVSFRDRNCLPLVWIDGNAATTAYLDPDMFDPHTLAGIEVYKGTATVPAALMGTRGQGSCGVIALWTKRVELRPKVAAKPVTAEELANLVASLRLYTADQVDRPAVPVGGIAPLYPDVMLSDGTPGQVVAEFVVDTTGRADMSTFGIVSTTHPVFADAVRRAVTDATFTPAIREGRTVRQLVQLPFAFTVPPP